MEDVANDLNKGETLDSKLQEQTMKEIDLEIGLT